LLGDRRRNPQPARRVGRHRNLQLPRLPPPRGATMSGRHDNLLASEVAAGQELPPLHFDVTATTIVLGALASRDWRPMHHDKDFAVERNGLRNIFVNTPNFQAWFERYLTDWSGPKGRLGRMTFKMKKSVFPGDRMTFSGRVTGTSTDETGCRWVDVDVGVSV